MKLKLLVIGHGRHGKDTVCEILRDKYGYTFESSSKFCSKLFIYDNLKDKYGYKDEEECYTDRHNHRQEWYDAICDYNVPDRRKINFHTCNMTKQGGIKLYRYQKLVTEYISPETPYRGLLVYQGLGSGKTILSISVLSNFIKREPDRTIIVVTPPGLRQNFEMELNKFSPFELFGQEIGKEVEEEIMKKIKNGNNDKIEQERKKIFRKYWEKRIAIYSYEELANRLQRRRVT